MRKAKTTPGSDADFRRVMQLERKQDFQRAKQIIRHKRLPRTEPCCSLNDLPEEALFVLRAIYGIGTSNEHGPRGYRSF